MKRNNPQGIKIRTLNYVMISVACILYAFLLFLTVQVFSRYEAMNVAAQDYIHCEKAASMVSHGSDVLTEQVRLYVVTEDLSHAEAYFTEANVTRSRDLGLAELERYHSDDDIYGYLETALNYSNDLMKREIYAMALTANASGMGLLSLPPEVQAVKLDPADMALGREGQLALARDMTFGVGYQEAKAHIMDNIDYCLNTTLASMESLLQQSVQDLNAAIQRQRLCCTLLFIMNVVFFLFVTNLIVRPLQIYIKNIGDNKTLEVIGSYEFKYLALTYNNIYEVNSANQASLRDQAEHDALTGINNRGAFDRLTQSMTGSPIPITLVLIDVDKFKSINDGLGHSTGDLLLKKVAALLRKSFRSTDFVGRIGGDEFCILLGEASDAVSAGVKVKIDRLNKVLRGGVDGLPPVSLSAGIASSHHGYDDALYTRADKALYASKEAGRGLVSFDPASSEDQHTT